MPTYNWPLIQQRSGESIESLAATLLRLEYLDARQVNPSQGDGGIDILRPTPDGLEIWQVKGFTTAMSDSQFRQVKKSWETFVKEHVTPGEHLIARYHPRRLDTPVAVEVRSDLYDGSTAVVAGEVKHTADGLVCVAQDTPTGRPWLAWVPTDRVRRVAPRSS